MAARKRFLLRIDERLFDAIERWAADELRSINGQMEYLLQDAARREGRLPGARPARGAPPPEPEPEPEPGDPPAGR